MTENPKHYSNIDREPHEGDRARCVIAPGRFGAVFAVDGTALAQVGNGWPSRFELVQPWWDVTAKPGTKWKDRTNSVWIKRYNGLWSAKIPEGIYSALELEDSCGLGERVTPEPAPTHEPTAPGVVVRGTIDGKTVRAIRECDGGAAWTIYSGRVVSGWLDWTRLLAMLDKPPTIIDTDQPAGLTEGQRNLIIRLSELFTPSIEDEVRDAFPDVFTEPEPGAEESKYGDGDLPYGLTVAEDGSYLDWRVEHYTRSSDIAVKPDPTGGDQVVMARTNKHDDAGVLYRCADGSWSRRPGRDIGTWPTGELLDVRRLQPATLADLMHNIEHTTKEN